MPNDANPGWPNPSSFPLRAPLVRATLRSATKRQSIGEDNYGSEQLMGHIKLRIGHTSIWERLWPQ
eukprot:1754800-Alexandrium_andersonii.AAC.1